MGANLKRMRSIKMFVIVVAGMLGCLGVVTLFLPSKVTVSKSILINATGAEVAREIGTFKNWKDWYPAFQNQHIIITTSQKSDSSFATLTDESQRRLSMSMLRRGPQNIDILLLAEDKKNITYQFIFSPDRTGQTQLTWNINTTLGWYPWKKIAGIFLDKVTGPQYQEALQNLKSAAEKTHQEASSK
jgi:polyketide cyclase/dehydrase/lipid transport protein